MPTIHEILEEEQAHEEKDLVRGLKSRHIQMIAIGGAIGVGLFLGSARAIQAAGPALLLSYALVGIVIFFIMRALGELLLYRPVAGSFATYAEEFVGPWAGFFTGWSYWFMWVVTGMAEITAVAVYVNYWFPDVPHWIPALITLGVLYAANLIAVGLFGELEFWFATIKVVTIIALIAIGLVVILFGFGELGQTASFSNLWAHGGFVPMGVVGVILSLQVVAFAFLGVELVGVTAGEAAESREGAPERDQRRGMANPDLLHRRPDHHHGARPLEPARPPAEPVRRGVRADRHPGGRGDHQFRRDHGGGVVVQQRHLQHRTDALHPGAVRAGAAIPRQGQRGARSCHGRYRLGGGDADRRRAQLRGAGAGVRVGHQRSDGRGAVDLGHDPRRPPRLPQGRGRRPGRAEPVPHAGLACHELDRAGVHRPGHVSSWPWTRTRALPSMSRPVWFAILAVGYQLTKSREPAVA